MVLETFGESMTVKFGPGVNPNLPGTLQQAVVTSPSTIDDCLEIVVAWLESVAGKTYFTAPLDEFQMQFGKVNHEDDFYQARMNYFLEYCILERPMTSSPGMRSPLSVFLEKNAHMTSGDDQTADYWRRFCGFRHGIFQVVKAGASQITVMDLLADGELTISSKSGETLKYFPRKSIFQGFVFGLGDRYMLGQGMIIHPEMACGQILKFFKNHKKFPRFAAGEIAKLMALTNMRYLRMQHVNPNVIYSQIST
jgi:hypothetical protein